MFKKALIIDNDTRHIDTLKQKLITDINLKSDIIDSLNSLSSIDNINTYDIFFIRYHDKTKELIDKLSDDDEKVIILTNKYDDNIREEILAMGVSDYIITDNNSRGDIASNLVKRLFDNSNLRVMIVDDSSLILNTLTILLDTQNLNYVRCKNGQEAWDYISKSESKKVDLVISDYEMPEMNGYELTKRIRSKYNKETLPILMLSGTEENSMIAKFLKAGVNDYIPKPFINEEFINRVSNTLTLLELLRK